MLNPLTLEVDVLERCEILLGAGSLSDLAPRYKDYLARSGSCMSFPDFIMAAAARSQGPSFLFEYTTLVFDMLKEPEFNGILIGRFCLMAPFLDPLASRQCPEKIFDAICSIPSVQDVLHDSHITLAAFKRYVNELRIEFDTVAMIKAHQAFLESLKLTTDSANDSRASVADVRLIRLRQRVALISTQATLKSTFANIQGTFIITESSIGFQTMTGMNLQILQRTHLFTLEHLVRASPSRRGLFKTDHCLVLEFDVESKIDILDSGAVQSEPSGGSFATSVQSVFGTGNTSNDDISFMGNLRRRSSGGSSDGGKPKSEPLSILEISFPSDVERDFVLSFLEDLLAALALSRQAPSPIVRQCIIHDAIDDILRVKALRSARVPCTPRTTTFMATSSIGAQQSYLFSLSSQFHDISISCGLFTSLVSQAPNRAFDDPAWDPRMLRLVDNPPANGPAADALDFDLLSDATKQLGVHFAHLELLIHLHHVLQHWHHPMLTAACVSFLLALAYYNCIAYLPALLLLANFVLLLLLDDRPQMFIAWISDQFEKFEQSRATANSATASKPPEKIALLDGTVLGRLKDKYDGIQETFISAKSGLETVQNVVQSINHFANKIKGLYTAVSPLRTRQFMAINALLFGIMLLPFRAVFVAIVLFHFTDHLRGPSVVAQRFLDSIPLADQPVPRPPSGPVRSVTPAPSTIPAPSSSVPSTHRDKHE